MLVVLTVGLVFDRRAREDADETIRTSSSDLKTTVDVAAADVVSRIEKLTEQVGRLQQRDHYRVVSTRSTWDITDGGAVAVTRKVRTLRFLRDRMVAVTDYSGIDEGSASEPRVASPFRWAGTIRDSGAGVNYLLVALDRMYNADEEITTDVAWTLTGSFLSEWQTVACRIQDDISHLNMKVIWPADRDLADVTLEYRLDRLQEDLSDKLGTTADGRRYYELDFPPKRDDVITIRWRWTSPAPAL